jgi:branched-chain amino acid transport system substrate-binding protein
MPGAALVRPRAAWAGALLAALAVAGCSTQTNSAVTVTGRTLTIYAGQPPGGAGGQTATDVLDAEALALQRNGSKVGGFTIRLIKLDGKETSANARSAISDKTAIAYLGELVPGTSQLSVPITNELDLLEVSPADTAIYLTKATPVVSGSPGTFYPSSSTYHQTFARVVPNTEVEAKAIVAEMESQHASKLFVASDGGPYGASIAAEVKQAASAAGLSTVSGASGADAVFYGGNVVSSAVKAVGAAASASPAAKLFVPSALYTSSFVSGLSSAAQRDLYVSSPGFTSSTLTPEGKQFVSAFQTAFGRAPAPQAIFGYEAMAAVLASIKQAGAQAQDRAAVVAEFRAIKSRSSVLGTYSIQGGDTTIAPFVFGRVQNGSLVPHAQGS